MLDKCQIRYKCLLPLLDTRDNLKRLVEYFKSSPIDLSQPNRILIKSKNDHVRSSFFSLLMTQKRYFYIQYMRTYRLVDIFLGQDEEFVNLTSLEAEVLFLYRYQEIPNKQLINMISYVVEQYRQKSIVFYLRGSDSELESLLKDEYFKVIDLDLILGQSKQISNSTSYGGYDL